MIVGLVSDSHGNTAAIDMMLGLPEAREAECWLHAGDFVVDAEYLEMVTSKKVYKVAGNGDWPHSKAPEDLMLELSGFRVMLTHGHEHGVRYGTEILAENALNMGADIAVYGHTHIADIAHMKGDDLLILNPGSISRPRDDSYGSFMLLELEKERAPRVRLLRLEDSDGSRLF